MLWRDPIPTPSSGRSTLELALGDENFSCFFKVLWEGKLIITLSNPCQSLDNPLCQEMSPDSQAIFILTQSSMIFYPVPQWHGDLLVSNIYYKCIHLNIYILKFLDFKYFQTVLWSQANPLSSMWGKNIPSSHIAWGIHFFRIWD